MEGQLNILHILWESGLIVKAVLLILIACSILSWAIIFKKRSLFKEINSRNQEFLDIYHNSNTLRDIYDRSQHLAFSPNKIIFDYAYKEFFKLSENAKGSDLKEHFKSFGLDTIERAIKRGINDSNIKLDESLSTLASISSAAPFIGLFGTVWGIIDSFTGLASGGATLDAVAPGIAEALVATAVGLVAAIPALWFFNKYSNEIGMMNTKMESLSQDILNLVERNTL